MRINSISTLLMLAISSIAVSASGCATNHDHQVLWADTKAYQKCVKSFKVSPEQADRLAQAEDGRRQAAGEESLFYFGPQPEAIVGNYYVFTKPNKVRGSLNGLYVNGNTGGIEFRGENRITTTRD